MYEVQDIPIAQLDVAEEDIQPIEREVIDDLKSDLRVKPLLHPITVVQSNGKFYVKAGRKRFYACKELEWKTMPCLVLSSDLTADDIEEITISENLKRYNLPWWEQVLERKRLHEIRQKQHGVGKQGAKVGWSLRDTAKELDIGFGTLSEDLRLAEAVLRNPNLKNIQDKVTAKRLIFREAQRIETETVAGLNVSVDHDCVLCGDAGEILKYYPDKTFDVVFTDPPWIKYKDEKLTKDENTLPVFEQVFRVMKPNAFLYMIVSTQDFFVYQRELLRFGFTVQQTPMFWVKTGTISQGLRAWEYARDFEQILLAVRGNPVLVDSRQYSSMYCSAAVHSSKLIHPNEKPVDVPMHFLRHCSYEGSMILDPFGGSGVVGEACIKMNRRYVIIEKDKKYADSIEKRLGRVWAEKGKP